jgi:hypothetical protein
LKGYKQKATKLALLEQLGEDIGVSGESSFMLLALILHFLFSGFPMVLLAPIFQVEQIIW